LAGGALLYSPFLSCAATQSKEEDPSELNLFFESCKSGELQVVKDLVTKNSSLLQSTDKTGRSGFTVALLNNHQEVSNYLKNVGYLTDIHESALDKNWDRFDELFGEENEASTQLMNADHPMGGSVMWAAAAGGAAQDMWRVYAGNADPNIQSKQLNSCSPLQKALKYYDLKIAEVTSAALLSNDTDPNPAANGALPPLHVAAQRGSTEMVEMLIRLGADVTTKDNTGKTAIQLAAYFGQKDTYAQLEQHQQINRTCRTSRYAYTINGEKYHCPDRTEIPLHIQGNVVGKAHRDLDAVKDFIRKNPKLVHSLATTSESAVEAGAHMGRKDIAGFLLESGAPYSMPTAVFMEDFSTVKKMLTEDPNRIHERGAHDFGLLWYTILGNGNLEMAQLLIDHGANVEEQHFLGTTALHWACFGGPIELVELFVENGANVNRIGRKFTVKGESPLQSTKDEKIRNYLKSKGAK